MSKQDIYIGLSLLDFDGVINVKRQVNDYRDLEIGASNKSYTFDVPLTPNNALILKFVNDIRSREEVSDEARIVLDGIEVIRGKFRILSLTRLYAKCIVEADDWIDDIKETSIKDLSWAGGDAHTFSAANISASWTASAGALYRYPLINFCELVSGDYAAGAKIYPYDFYPMWNIEDIVTKIFTDSGYTIAGGSFFAGTFGRSLYLLSAPVVRSDDFISGKNLDVYVDDDTDNYDTANVASGGTGNLTVTQVVDIDAETEDEGSDFSTTTNRYTAPEAGVYRFQGQITVWCTFNRSPAQWTVLSNNLTFTIRKNGATTLETLSASAVTSFDSANSVYTLDTGYIYLAASDTVEMYVSMAASGTNDSPGALDCYLYLDAGATTTFLKNVWDDHCLWPGVGETMSPATHLPDIDSLEFLKGLKRALNLRFFMDRLNRTIYIETSNEFYNTGTEVIDWTDIIDYSDDPVLSIVSSDYTKTQKLRWKPDQSDKAYMNYISESGEPYEKVLTLDSLYCIPGITENENPAFSPTILGNMNQIHHYGGLIPKILGQEEFVSPARPYPLYRSKQWQPRIFKWNGMTALGSGSWNWHDDIEDASGTAYTTFPSVETPDMNDLYDDYWAKDYRRIDENKLLTCTLKIKPHQFIPFTTVVGTAWQEGFRAKYKLNVEGIDMLFVITKITTDGDRVKCEFMQIL